MIDEDFEDSAHSMRQVGAHRPHVADLLTQAGFTRASAATRLLGSEPAHVVTAIR